MWNFDTKTETHAYWISCSARFLCRVDAPSPAAPTSRSSRSNWQSSWRESLWAVARRGSRSPLRCPDRTARPWSSSVSPDWPAKGTERLSTNTQPDLRFFHFEPPTAAVPPWNSLPAPGSRGTPLECPPAPVGEGINTREVHLGRLEFPVTAFHSPFKNKQTRSRLCLISWCQTPT